MTDRRKYKRAFTIACELLIGGSIYGVDSDKLFEKLMDIYGVVSSATYEKFILQNLDWFSDNEIARDKAIERLGW